MRSGGREPVVLVHAGVFAGWYKPLLDEPALGRYRVLTYHRMAMGQQPHGRTG